MGLSFAAADDLLKDAVAKENRKRSNQASHVKGISSPAVAAEIENQIREHFPGVDGDPHFISSVRTRIETQIEIETKKIDGILDKMTSHYFIHDILLKAKDIIEMCEPLEGEQKLVFVKEKKF